MKYACNDCEFATPCEIDADGDVPPTLCPWNEGQRCDWYALSREPSAETVEFAGARCRGCTQFPCGDNPDECNYTAPSAPPSDSEYCECSDEDLLTTIGTGPTAITARLAGYTTEDGRHLCGNCRKEMRKR